MKLLRTEVLPLGLGHWRKFLHSLWRDPDAVSPADSMPAALATDIELDGLGVSEKIELWLAKLGIMDIATSVLKANFANGMAQLE